MPDDALDFSGSPSRSATRVTRIIGVVTFRPIAIPIPLGIKSAVGVGESTAATDWKVVARPRAVPVFPPHESTAKACMIGNMAELRNPAASARAKPTKTLPARKNKTNKIANEEITTRIVLFLGHLSDAMPRISFPNAPKMRTRALH